MMRSLVVITIISLLIFSCKEKENKINYLQKEDVQLVQPRVVATNTVIDSFVIVKSDFNVINDVEIYYTNDRTEPTKNSIKFIEELKVKEPNELKFKAFHKNFKASKTASIKLYKKGHSANSIEWFTQANEKYKGVGASTLINGKKASLEYNNPQWIGFDTIAKATVKFDKKIPIKSIDIGYLSDPGSWIFPPTEIEVIINNNKRKRTFKLEPITTMTDRLMENFSVPINQEVITLSILVKNVQAIPDWHDGKGNKAWLFMDEWIFN